MSLWQIDAANEMKEFLCGIIDADKIGLTGSKLEPASLDVFSDVDIEIHLPVNVAVDIKLLLRALAERFCAIFGYEFHSSSDGYTLRICFENGWRFDLSFITPELGESRSGDDSFEDRVDAVINRFWFLSSMVLVKLGRNDYLIAAHLVLELCQLIIHVQMLMRDEAKKTDKHKFGDCEDVPILHSLVQKKKRDTEDEILYILFQAAENMDKMSAKLELGYHNRNNKLRELLYEPIKIHRFSPFN